MRNVLVLGGTGWLGRAIVRSLLAEGAAVTCVARGVSGQVPDGARLVRVDRRSPTAYDEVRSDWDEVVELADEPDLVESALVALGHRAAHWTLVSTVSVYASNDQPDADESAPVVEPVDTSRYPDAKVAAERATTARVGARLLVVRPGLIVGPEDPSDRFSYWPARFSRPGPVLVPGTPGRFVQVIHVADLAEFVRHAGARAHTGVVNAVGPSIPMDDFLVLAADVAGSDARTVPVDDETLLAQDVRYWAGPRSLPLWMPFRAAALAQRSDRAFVAAGGTTRPLRDTLTDVLADERARGLDRDRVSGLTLAGERAVLESVRA